MASRLSFLFSNHVLHSSKTSLVVSLVFLPPRLLAQYHLYWRFSVNKSEFFIFIYFLSFFIICPHFPITTNKIELFDCTWCLIAPNTEYNILYLFRSYLAHETKIRRLKEAGRSKVSGSHHVLGGSALCLLWVQCIDGAVPDSPAAAETLSSLWAVDSNIISNWVCPSAPFILPWRQVPESGFYCAQSARKPLCQAPVCIWVLLPCHSLKLWLKKQMREGSWQWNPRHILNSCCAKP